MATVGDVHVGDIGTLYHAKIQDAGVSFDPSAATVKKLIFKTRGAAGTIERVAVITHVGSDWFLDYTVTSADTTFHDTAGTYSWQGYVEFAGGEHYHTNIETYTVSKNLN